MNHSEFEEFQNKCFEFLQTQQRMARTGPNKDSIRRYAVRELQEYFDIFKKRNTKEIGSDFDVLLRGQDQEYLLPGTNEISLLPSAGRPGATLQQAGKVIQKAYVSYWLSMLRTHFEIVCLSGSEVRDILDFIVFLSGSEVRDLSDIKLDSFEPHNNLGFVPVTQFGCEILSRAWDPITFKATAQHYGLTTLNLDVTLSPVVALFFATHELQRDNAGALRAYRNDKVGMVYVLTVPKKPLRYFYRYSGGELEFELPRYVNLFNLFYDNDSRPRRQAAALLTEVGNLGYEPVSQLNAYSSYIHSVIEISPEFYQTREANEFLNSLHIGRLFPGSSVDDLYGRLRKADPSRIVKYVGSGQTEKDPLGRFEYLLNRRIFLVGNDASAVKTLLQSSWFARQNNLELYSVDEAISELCDRSKDRIDAVIFCEPIVTEAERLGQQVLKKIRGSNRITHFAYSCYANGSIALENKPRPLLVQVGDRTHAAIVDSHDSDLYTQRMILNGLLQTSRLRTRRWLSSWKDFLDWKSPLRTY
ncbi:FRG domain-containing protein [bacterium]|nr:FRG domain-containing protein [bacterium]